MAANPSPALGLIEAIAPAFPAIAEDIRASLRLKDYDADTPQAAVFVAQAIESVLVLPIRLQWDIADGLADAVGMDYRRMFVSGERERSPIHERLVHERVIERRAQLELLIERLSLWLRRIAQAYYTPDDPESGASNPMREPDLGGGPGGGTTPVLVVDELVEARSRAWEEELLAYEAPEPDYDRELDLDLDQDESHGSYQP